MDFYEEASLVMVPSGYKDQKVYSSVPDDGSGDLTFSRASTATRVNSDGYIEKAQVNLLTYSNDFNGAGWSAVSATMTGGQAGYDGTNDAWLFDSTAGYIASSPTVSGVATFSVYAKKGTADGIRLRIDAATDANCYINLNDGTEILSNTGIALSVVSVGSGWYRIALSINDSSISNVRFYAIDNTGISTTGTVYIQDAQVNYGLVAQDYIETTTASVTEGVAIDVPRLNYDPVNPTSASLLLEKSSTNLLKLSELFTDSYWGSISSSITANAAISPEGVQNAFNMPAASGLGNGLIRISNISSSTQYVCTIYAKSNGATSFKMRLFDGSTGQSTTETKTATSEWQRFEITRTSGASTSQIRFDLFDNDGDLLIYGAQFEAGSYATSYIPTYGSSATRTAEVSYASNQFNNIGQTEGTVYAEFFLPVNVTSTENRFSLSDNTLNNWFFVSLPESGNKTRMYLRVGASTAVDVQTATSIFNYGQVNKVAMAYKSGDSRVYVNGVSVLSSTNTFGSPTSELDVFVITGSSGTGSASTQNISNQIKQALLFKTRLSNASLSELTTL